jgi:hypothetical protein
LPPSWTPRLDDALCAAILAAFLDDALHADGLAIFLDGALDDRQEATHVSSLTEPSQIQFIIVPISVRQADK